jgi:peroxiredoxin
VDSVDDNRRLADELGLDFPILSDSERRAVAAYGVVHAGGGLGGTDIARPATFLVGPEGTVRWRELAENWRIRVRPDTIFEAIHGSS